MGMSALARVGCGCATLVCGILAACAGTTGTTEGGDCVSHYEHVASARSWNGLKDAMTQQTEWGHVVSVRTQARGHDVGAGDQDAVMVIDLLNRSGRRLVVVPNQVVQPGDGWLATEG
jgi:hypothetical protein